MARVDTTYGQLRRGSPVAKRLSIARFANAAKRRKLLKARYLYKEGALTACG